MEHETGLLEDASVLTRELRKLIHDQLQLAGLETRLAALGLMKMTAAAAGIGVLLATAWLGLTGAVVLGLITGGLSPAYAMLMVTALNLGAAAALWAFIRHRSRILGLPTTLRTLA